MHIDVGEREDIYILLYIWESVLMQAKDDILAWRNDSTAPMPGVKAHTHER